MTRWGELPPRPSPSGSYEVPGEHVVFAHRLIDGGVDLVHGHSLHHPRPIQIYRDKLVLYGCGDFVSDYEGIRIAVLQSYRLRLQRASSEDCRWLSAGLSEASRVFGTRVVPSREGSVVVQAGQ